MEHNRVSAPSEVPRPKLVRVDPELLLFEGKGGARRWPTSQSSVTDSAANVLDEIQRTITSNMTLHNKTSDHVAFKIKTTRPKGYCVRPNSGVILPNGSTQVEGIH